MLAEIKVGKDNNFYSISNFNSINTFENIQQSFFRSLSNNQQKSFPNLGVSIVIILIGFVLLGGGEGDLVEDELGDGVGEGRGNWEVGRFGLVGALGIGNVGEFEGLAVGELESHGPLGLNSAIGARAVSGFLDGGSVAGFEVEAVLTSFWGVFALILGDFDVIVVIVGGAGCREGKEGEKDELKIN